MAEERKWRDAKLPQWVRDQIEAELVAASLAWPTEAEPAPMPFKWEPHGYCTNPDHVVPGIYWFDSWRGSDPQRVEIVARGNSSFAHKFDGQSSLSQPYVKGPLYASPRDVILARLWRECREAAAKLHNIRRKL